jgi:hypothetical protein
MRLLLLTALAATTLPAQREPAYPLRQLQPVREIGTDEAAGVFLATIRGVAVSTTNRLYVIDGSDRNVKSYDARNGKFLQRYGREGSGPGEFRIPNVIALRDSMLVVTDATNGYVEYHVDGRPLRTVRERPVWMDKRPMRSGNFVVIATDAVPRPPMNGPPVPITTLEPLYKRVLVNTASGRTDTIAKLRLDLGLGTLEGDRGMTMAVSTGFGAQGVHEIVGDSLLVIADGYNGEVRYYRFSPAGATLARTVSLRQTGSAVSAEDIAEAGRRLARSSRRVTSTGAPGGAMAVQSATQPTGANISHAPDRWSVATRILVSHDGTVAVGAPLSASDPTTRAMTTQRNVFTVIPANGQPYRVQLTDSQYLWAIHAGEFYVSDRNDDEPVIRVLRPR